ncbi:MAG: hypothetical protein KC547_16555 [Anaerolineae bacterium]|nr:hypothetical protein [Anaerolineae bacterium]
MRKWLYLVGVLLLTLLVLPVTVMAQAGEPASRTGFRPDAPTYGVRGPYPVGARDVMIDDESGLEGVIWYPALNPDGAAEHITYTNKLKFDFLPSDVTTLDGRALRDAAADLSAAPYPLVVLSPGFALGNTTYAWLAEHLASYGFVVISPDHQEMYEETFADNWRAVVRRPQDVLTTLAYIDDVSADGGLFAGLIDTERSAVVGHSTGGYTALAAAGGRVDAAGFTARCETALAANDPDAWLCGIFMPNVANMAELAGLNPVPEGLWPSWAAPGVDAIVAHGFDIGENDIVTSLARASLNIDHHLCRAIVDHRVSDDRNRAGLTRCKTARGLVGAVTEGLDHLKDAFSGFGRDTGMIVDDTRNGLIRHASLLRHVQHRYPF